MTTNNNDIPFEVLDYSVVKVIGEAASLVIHYNTDGTYDVDAESNFLLDGQRLRATSTGVTDERLKKNIGVALQREITDEEYVKIVKPLKEDN